MQTDPPGGTGVSFWQSIELKRHNQDVSRERQFDNSNYFANCDARETCGLDLRVRQRASPRQRDAVTHYNWIAVSVMYARRSARADQRPWRVFGSCVRHSDDPKLKPLASCRKNQIK